MSGTTLGLHAPPELLRCKPATVVAVRTGGFFGEAIRFGAGLKKLPNTINHIALVDHVTDTTVWGIEASPGGVGDVDLSKYFIGINGKYTVTNWKQPIPDDKRERILEIVRAMKGKTTYDWPAIAADALEDLHLPGVWADHETWGQLSPAHVVCSSLAAWAYEHEDQHGPYTLPAEGIRGGVRTDLPLIQPGNWAQFIIENGYN